MTRIRSEYISDLIHCDQCNVTCSMLPNVSVAIKLANAKTGYMI